MHIKHYVTIALLLGVFFISCSQLAKTPKLTIVQKDDFDYLEKNETILTLSDSNNIAIVFASKRIKKYALNLQNIALSYTLSQNTNISLIFKDFKNEKITNLHQTFKQLEQQKITKAILLITDDFKDTIDFNNEIFASFKSIYLPASKQNNNTINSSNIIYGAIDYDGQIDALLKIKRNSTNLVNLYEKNKISLSLTKTLNTKANVTINKKITPYTRAYSDFLKKTSKIENSTIFLNTGKEKSAIALSQLITHNINATIILSTQINFASSFLSTTQVYDRQKLIIANSIPKLKNDSKLLNDVLLLFPNVMNSWISYSILIGLEYLDKGEVSSFDEIKIQNNTVIYPIHLYYYGHNSFFALGDFEKYDYSLIDSDYIPPIEGEFNSIHKEYNYTDNTTSLFKDILTDNETIHYNNQTNTTITLEN